VVIYDSSASANRPKSTTQDAWSEMGKFMVGLPSTALLPSEELLVVYYAGLQTDRTDIRWARIRINGTLPLT